MLVAMAVDQGHLSLGGGQFSLPVFLEPRRGQASGGWSLLLRHPSLSLQTWGHLRFMNCWALLWTRVVNSHLVCLASGSWELTPRVRPLEGEAREAVLQRRPTPCQTVHERRHPHKQGLPP